MAEHPEASRVATVAPGPAYVVIIEEGPHNYSAYAPDLPGCIATGATIEEVTRLMREGIPFHLEGMRQDGEPIPPPRTRVALVTADGDIL